MLKRGVDELRQLAASGIELLRQMVEDGVVVDERNGERLEIVIPPGLRLAAAREALSRVYPVKTEGLFGVVTADAGPVGPALIVIRDDLKPPKGWNGDSTETRAAAGDMLAVAELENRRRREAGLAPVALRLPACTPVAKAQPTARPASEALEIVPWPSRSPESPPPPEPPARAPLPQAPAAARTDTTEAAQPSTAPVATPEAKAAVGDEVVSDEEKRRRGREWELVRELSEDDDSTAHRMLRGDVRGWR